MSGNIQNTYSVSVTGCILDLNYDIKPYELRTKCEYCGNFHKEERCYSCGAPKMSEMSKWIKIGTRVLSLEAITSYRMVYSDPEVLNDYLFIQCGGCDWQITEDTERLLAVYNLLNDNFRPLEL
jgi:hypothetical protein